MTIQQISVFLENRAGQLAEIADVLAESGVDLRAIHIAETADYGVLRIIAGKAKEAADILLAKGFVLSMTPVLAVNVPDQPGGLANLLSAAAKAGVDIEYMYSMLAGKDGLATMLFRVEEPEKLEKVFAENGIATADSVELGIE